MEADSSDWKKGDGKKGKFHFFCFIYENIFCVQYILHNNITLEWMNIYSESVLESESVSESPQHHIPSTKIQNTKLTKTVRILNRKFNKLQIYT